MINLILYLDAVLLLLHTIGKSSCNEVKQDFVSPDRSYGFPLISNKGEDVTYDESVEEECSRGYFYHLRGRRCVPYRCGGRIKFRNKETGECVPRREFNYRFLNPTKNFRRFLPRTIQKPRTRYRFALPNKLKG